VLIGILVAVVNVLVIAYIFLLIARNVLSLFPGASMGRPWDLLCRVTNPYLGLFYRLRFLRRGRLDFTPMAAALVLVVFATFVNELFLRSGHLVGRILSAVLISAWIGCFISLLLFIVLGVLRTMPRVFRALPGATLWENIDRLMLPLVTSVTRLFRLEGRASYAQRLLLALGLLLAALFFGHFAIMRLARLLESLPF
jgi:YggT family protein